MRRGALLLVILAGCAEPELAPSRPQPVTQPAPPDDGPADHPGSPVPPPKPPAPPAPTAKAVLDIHAMDIWGQYLPDKNATLTVAKDGAPVAGIGFPIARVELGSAGFYTITAGAPDHESLWVKLYYDGSASSDGVILEDSDGLYRAGFVLSHDSEVVSPGHAAIPVHRLFLGLRHKWFAASGRPARRGNDLRFMMDGEEAWGTVQQALTAASRSILLASWWFDSTFELSRDPYAHATESDAARRANTILNLLDASPASKRVLIGQFWSQDGLLDWVSADSAIRARGAAAGDNFEFMGQANLTAGRFHFRVDSFLFSSRLRARADLAALHFDPDYDVESTAPEKDIDLTHWPINVAAQVASYHQKFMVLDGELAFVGGMNLQGPDWDTSDHLVFEPRRMKLSASLSERLDVVNKTELPDQVPRKDYLVRVHGPSAQDVADVFKERWDSELAAHVDYSQNASTFAVERNIGSSGSLQAQVTVTLPEPFWEHSILETWLNAVGNAQDFIYIEDQYFRAPVLNDAIVARMNQVPGLKLVVITTHVSEWTDPGCFWTAKSVQRFQTLFPDRFKLLQLRAFDYVHTWGWQSTESRFADIYVHAKMLIVDDKFMSVGSANKNNRGVLYEGEMSLAVLDPTWVRAARRRIFANLMPGLAETNDSNVWWDQLTLCQNWNDYVAANWAYEEGDIHLSSGEALPEKYSPFGFVYSLHFRDPSHCLIEDIGEDLT